MSSICDVQLPTVKDIGISSDMPIPLVWYKGQIMPMQPGMTIPSCFLPVTTPAPAPAPGQGEEPVVVPQP